jgi:hypothetical protein
MYQALRWFMTLRLPYHGLFSIRFQIIVSPKFPDTSDLFSLEADASYQFQLSVYTLAHTPRDPPHLKLPPELGQEICQAQQG